MCSVKSRKSINALIFAALPFLLTISVALPVWSQVSITTEGYDNSHTGSNLSETILNTSNVNVNQFGKLFTYTVDGSVYAQPLYVPNVSIPGNGSHNVVYIATMNDVVYAFDADNNSGTNAAPLWTVDLRNPAAGVTPVPIVDIVGTNDGNIVGNVGIESTPSIDLTSNTMYLLARTLENGSFVQRLHALDITTGAEKFSGPSTISASVTGSGTASVNGTLVFNPQIENQRAALAVSNGMVFIAWASHGDLFSFHGWIMAYDTKTLQQVAVTCITPNGSDGGIWMSGRGPVVDSSGNVYYMTSNGDWDGSTNFGDSFMKFTPGTDTISLTDWFTPDNWLALSQGDIDLGSSGPLLIPGTNLLAGAGKAGVFYVVSTANMGHEWAGNTQIVQSFPNGGGSLGPAYYNRTTTPGPWMYAWGFNGNLNAYYFNGTTFDTTPISQSTISAASGSFPAALAVTANGSVTGTGIVWASMPPYPNSLGGVVGGVIRAFDASDLTNELWDSLQNPSRDDIGTWAKFRSPVVVNGKLYMSSFSNTVAVYGLLPTTPDFTLSPTPASVSFVPGGSASYTVGVGALNGFNGTVNFAVTGLPNGDSASFNPPSVTGSGSTTLTVTTAANTPLVSSMLTITGTSNSLSHGETVTLLAPTPDFTVSPSAASATFVPGGAASYTVNIGSLYGFAGTVSLSVGGLPAGASASFNPATVNGSGATVLTVTTAANTVAASSTLTITAVSEFLSHGASVTLMPAVSISPSSVTLLQNGTQQAQQFTAVVQNSTNQSVNWSVSPPVGNISASGLYTAPPVTVTQLVTVTATSATGSTQFGIATVNLAVPATAAFSLTDTTTQGNWQGVYGSDGYSIAQSAQSIPGYASFAVDNQVNYTWIGSTTDPRALQVPGSSGGIASAWYSPGTFTLDLSLTDGNPHVIALYALDWDGKGRAETVQVVDANVGTILDTRSIAGFTNGTYLVWKVSGHVQINVTPTAGPNGVISGIFLGENGTGGPETVSVSPTSVSLAGGGTQLFGATVTNGTGPVTWSISAVNPTTAAQGGISTTGLYTAPGTVSVATTVTVMATSADGTAFGMATVNLSPGSASGEATATFLPPKDTTTEGSWQGKYGSDGYDLEGVSPTSVPSYATFAVQNAVTYTWVSGTSDARALQVPGGSGGIAAAWYNPGTFSFTVNFTDGQTHEFAIYALDWDGKGRTETFQIVDANSGNQLDSETISSFGNGVYLSWNITGSVKINVTTVGGPNAVVNGVFFSGSSGSGGGGGGTETVTVSPTSANLVGGGTQQFGATVTNGTGAVTWSISAVNPTTAAEGSISTTGLYMAPATVTVATTVTVEATSADGTASGTATVNLSAGGGTETVTVSPTSVSLAGGGTQQFGATVTNGTGAVTWSISAVNPTTAAEGSISTTGLYTAPSTVTVATTVTVKATSADTTASGTATVTLSPSSGSGGATATFLSQDTTTEGSWQGKYGSGGYDLEGVTPSVPSYATFAEQNALTYTWAYGTSDARALQIPGGPGGIAAAWYSSAPYSLTVDFTDGQTHEFTIYALDWDGKGRTETFRIVDANSGNQLDSETISSFGNGVYLSWNITGSVKINVTTVGGPNAVVNGVFFSGSSGSGGGGGTETVTVSPTSANLVGGGTQQFGATVTNGTGAVTWSISAVNPTTAAEGSISTTGLYTAPSTVTVATTVTVEATSADTTASGTATVTLSPSSGSGGATATFLSQDTTTKGSWEGKYGSGGYDLANVPTSVPSYATFAVQNALSYTWASPTSDARALQNPNGSGGIAATWYSNAPFSFTLSFTDGATHQFALYAVDWDNLGRSETVQIVDANSGNQLDSETISNFGNGVYLSWNITGSVKINVTPTGTVNAVVSGVFFGGAATIPVITATSGSPQSAGIGTAFAPLIATVTSGSSPMSNVQVTFTAPSTGASGTFSGGSNTAIATTNGQGVATSPTTFTANMIAGGPYTVTATVSGASSPANFSLTNSSGTSVAASITATGGTSQSATVGTAFAVPLQVTVEDSLTNPVPNVTVTFAAPTSGASGTFSSSSSYIATAITNNQGIATAPTFTANTATGGPYDVTAAVSGVTTSATFALTNTQATGCVGNCAAFVSKDGNTEGNWDPTYGADGYSLANSAQSIPSYATFTPENEVTYTWNSGTSDPRALQIPGSTAGIAAAWYNTSSFTFLLNMGSSSHQFAIYALDWDGLGRSETIEIEDANTGAPLDTETISSFGTGAYLVWNISGQVKIVVSSTTGPNAVVSGVFFGGAPPPAKASFVNKDVTTEGAWQTHYGADGYVLANVTAQIIPPYASLGVQYQTNYTWIASTTDARALQIPGGSGGIAAAWYTDSSFYIDINVGSSSHPVSLYALDWDGRGRAETVQIVDANSGSVLDTESVSAFSTGVYLVWNITGHVRAVVTLTGGPNGVISGAFFN